MFVVFSEQCKYRYNLPFSDLSHFTELDDVSFTVTYTCDPGYEGEPGNRDAVVYFCSLEDTYDENFHDCTGMSHLKLKNKYFC